MRESNRFCWAKSQAYRLNGVYYWHKGLYSKAFVWWGKSLETASSLGATYEAYLTNQEINRRSKKMSPPFAKGKVH